MTKKELAKKVAEQTDLTQPQALAAVNAMIEAASCALSVGDWVILRGFGSLKPIQRKGKVARDITRKAAVWIPPHKIVKFDMSKELARRCNG